MVLLFFQRCKGDKNRTLTAMPLMVNGVSLKNLSIAVWDKLSDQYFFLSDQNMKADVFSYIENFKGEWWPRLEPSDKSAFLHRIDF